MLKTTSKSNKKNRSIAPCAATIPLQKGESIVGADHCSSAPGVTSIFVFAFIQDCAKVAGAFGILQRIFNLEKRQDPLLALQMQVKKLLRSNIFNKT
jgi:hypothetical protein